MNKSAYTSGQLTKFTDLMYERNMTPARFQKVLASGILADLFNEQADLTDRVAVCKALKLDLERLGIFHFVVDYHRPVEERIAACKKDFPWIIDLKEPSFARDVDVPIQYESCLLEFPHDVSRSSVLRRIASRDKVNSWHPADTDHMLAFATKYPHVTQHGDFKYIVGLGTTASVLIRMFQGMGSGCSYILAPLAREWNEHGGGKDNRFLIVRKV